MSTLKMLESWCSLPTPMGEFRMYDSGDEHVRVVCLGEIEDQGPEPLLRVHSSCLASEVFGAVDCDCADQLREAMKLGAAFTYRVGLCVRNAVSAIGAKRYTSVGRKAQHMSGEWEG